MYWILNIFIGRIYIRFVRFAAVSALQRKERGYTIAMMKSILLLLMACIYCQGFSINKSPHKHIKDDTTDSATSRRDMLHSMLAMTSTIGIISSNPSTSAAASKGGEVFVGKYSDPNNHPGGTRTVKLLDGSIGDYQLAEVRGGGGLGEPKDYTLPAIVVGGRAIIIDFSPKGGPRDFSGVIQKDGSIKFIRDGNVWPRLE